MTAESLVSKHAPALLMAGSALAWYVASYFASEALAGDRAAAPRARALGHWIPIALFALFAALARQADIAVGVIFATSVAVISLVMGVVAITLESAVTHAGGFPVVEHDGESLAPLTPIANPDNSAGDRRAWGFVLPAALLVLVAGFRGVLQPIHGVALLVEGLVILLLFRETRDATSPAPMRPPTRRIIEFALAAALSVLTAWAALRATRDMSDKIGIASALPVTAWMIAPALVLPMIGSGMHVARHFGYSAVVSTSVGVAILNLCVALPMVIAIWHWQPDLPGAFAAFSPIRQVTATTAPATTQSIDPALAGPLVPPLPFPISVWRVDTVILILLGLMLLPMSFGRWSPGRGDGVILVFVYLGYMWLTAWAGRG